MRMRITLWLAGLLLVGLAVPEAHGFGRLRARLFGGGCSGGGCGAGPGFYGGCNGGGCDANGFGGNFGNFAPSAWAWRTIGSELLLEDTSTGTLYARHGDGIFRAVQPILGSAAPSGGASSAIAADRATRPQAVFTLDPLTGVRRQVGWMSPEGVLMPLTRDALPPTVAPPKDR